MGAIDEFLIERLNCQELLTEDEDEKVQAYLSEVIDTTSPKDIRESLIALGRKLYAETFEGTSE